jgi:hypothetical protein
MSHVAGCGSTYHHWFMAATSPQSQRDADSVIEFERVSLAQARSVAKELLPGVQRMFDAVPGGWDKLRTSNGRQRLSTNAMAWLTSMPPALRPLKLAVHFPHVVNKLALLWNKPAELETYFDSLINDRRKNRKGFPEDVRSEIKALHRHA